MVVGRLDLKTFDHDQPTFGGFRLSSSAVISRW